MDDTVMATAQSMWAQFREGSTTNSTSYSEQYRSYHQQYYDTWRQQQEYQLFPQGVQIRNPMWAGLDTIPNFIKKTNRKILLLL